MPFLSFPPPPDPSCGRSFLDVVEVHGAALVGVCDHATLAAWHADFGRAWTRDAELLAADANRTLGLQGVQVIQPDVGYLAVETAPAEAPRAHRWRMLGCGLYNSLESERVGRAVGLQLFAGHVSRTVRDAAAESVRATRVADDS